MKLGVFFMFIFISSFSSSSLGSPFGFTKKSFLGFVEGSYYSTKNNFDGGNNVVPLPSSNSFREYRLDGSASYDFTNSWSAYSKLSFKRTESLGFPIERNNTGLSEATLGTDLAVINGFLMVIPDLSVTFPAHGKDTQTALLDDNVIQSTFKLFVTKSFSKFSFGGYGGYTLRNEGFSHSIPWGVLSTFSFSVVFFDLKVYGEKSIQNDTNSSQTTVRLQPLLDYNAGSSIYRGINPTFMAGQFRVGIRITPGFFGTAGIDHTFYGQNYAAGTRFLVGLGLQLPEPPDPSFETAKSFSPLSPMDSDSQGFTEDVSDKSGLSLDSKKEDDKKQKNQRPVSPIR